MVKEWLCEAGSPIYIATRIMLLQKEGYIIEFIGREKEHEYVLFAYKCKK